MRPRGIAIATFFLHAAAFGLVLGLPTNASADSIAEKALPKPLTAVVDTAVVVPVAVGPAALPTTALATTSPPTVPLSAEVAPATEPAAVQPREGTPRGERKMIFSYILLRSLQGAGPFTGR